MKILITGANGFIGKYLSKALSDSYEVFSIVSPRSVMPDTKQKYTVDLMSDDDTLAFIGDQSRQLDVDIVINLAAKVATKENKDDAKIICQNIKITENVSKIVRACNASKLINFSSTAVYPSVAGTYYEDSMVDPSMNNDCYYGVSKFCSEIILEHAFSDQDISISHLRVGQVYGDGMRSDRIIPVMRKELGDENTITLFGNGERVGNFISLDDLGRKLNLFLKNDVSGIYNVVEENLSYLDLARRVIDMYGDKGSRIIKKEPGMKEKIFIESKRKYD